MNNSLTISVVVPCFNDGRFLKECLKSVSEQTLQPAEILVIDDGSTDPKTIKFLQQIEIPRVRVIHQENRGLAGARNTGVRNSYGKYIYFLDADDLIHPQCLAKLARMLEESNDAIAAISRIRILGGSDHGTVWGEPCNPYLILVNNQWAAGIMLRRETVDKYNLWYDESMRSGYEDWELHIRVAKTGKTILFCPEPLYQYRVRKRSLLSTSRERHVEIVNYIRNKHADCYAYNKLLELKRKYAPAVLISFQPEEKDELEEWLNSQTFRDWTWAEDTSESGLQRAPYRFFHSSVDALHRLPPEALECALIALGSNSRIRNCVLAVRETCLSLFATDSKVAKLDGRRHPIALITRTSVPVEGRTLPEILGNCDLLVEFPDQRPESRSGWDQNLLRFPENSHLSAEGVDGFRKRLSLFGKKLFGGTFHRTCVHLYDQVYYRVLCSDEAFALRRRVQNALGPPMERYLSALIYGLLLTKAPVEENIMSRRIGTNSSKKVSPLFITPSDGRIHILIATAWITEGGVEQEIFDLCKLLNSRRFRVTIATTLPSSHPWDALARKIGASVYHLADFLRPSEMANGFLHLVLNHRVDCAYIVNSQMAYRVAKTLKRIAPYLPVVDRNVAMDPGGGFPLVSAKVGRQFIDLRTVSHRKLAEHMYKNYHLQEGSLRVVYAGTDIKRINEALTRKNGLLHKMCSLPPDTPVVIFVGRLTYQKRPEVFVRSVATILDIKPDCKAHFAMMGDGELKESVQNLIFHYKLGGSIHLLGTHPNAVDLMADATLLMMPSAYEGLALVSYEAMALGVPQIFANVNGQSELITPETGILIDNGPGEEARYAHACLELLSDTARRARMAAAGKQRIRSYFSAENAVREYSQIFEELAELSRKRGSEIPSLRPPHIDPLHALS